jgi:hypothetical protein
MKPKVTMRRALADPQLFGNVLVGDSWFLWRVMLIASMGEPLEPDELEAFKAVSGRTSSPECRIDEGAFIIGRRGGKDRATSVLVAYLAGLCDHSDVLVPGETGTCIVFAPDLRQAKVQLNYVEGVFRSSPLLGPLVEGRVGDVLTLSTGIVIETRGADYRRLRGMTAIAAVASEVAFFFTDQDHANADAELLNAVRPALSTTHGPLILISSPHSQRGELFEMWRWYYGQDDPHVLVALGASRTFNSTLSEAYINRALEKDPIKARSDYLCEWRTDVGALLCREAVESVVSTGVLERPPLDSIVYFGFADMASGSGDDSAALAIAHREDGAVVLDLVREVRPKFSPEQVVAEFAQLMKRYRCSMVTSDRWAPGFTREAFARHDITHMPSTKTASELFIEPLPRINSREVSLIDDQRLHSQLISLERSVAKCGRDSISAMPGQHDDVACAAAGAIWLAASQPAKLSTYVGPLIGCFSSPRSFPGEAAYSRDETMALARADGGLRKWGL